MNKNEWISEIKKWIRTKDKSDRDTVSLDLSKSGLTYHEVWKAVEDTGYEQENLELDENGNVDAVTFVQKPNEEFQLELINDENIVSSLVKFY